MERMKGHCLGRSSVALEVSLECDPGGSVSMGVPSGTSAAALVGVPRRLR